MTIFTRHPVNIIWAFGRNISGVHGTNIQFAIFRFTGMAFIARVSLVVGVWLVAGSATGPFVHAGGSFVVAAARLVSH